MDVGDHALIRGLVTASPLMRPGASRSYCGRRHGRPQSVRRQFPYRCPAPTPAQPYNGSDWSGGLLGRLHLPSDRPDETCEFACHGGDRDGELFAA